MRAAVLGSGSSGNALVVESGSKRLMIDAGFSCREIEKRLAMIDVDCRDFDGLVLTHEHSDHTRGVSRFARRNKVPIYATEGTLAELSLDARFLDIHVLTSGQSVEIGDFVIEPFAIPHDAREPIGVVVEDSEGHRLGLVADLGSRSQLAWARLTELDFLVLETNHDLDMLRSGPYPWPLKQRVAGRHGHLSNREAAEGIGELDTRRLKWAILYHLSRTNNLPALALQAAGEALSKQSSEAQLCVTLQTEPTAWLELETQPV
jgi:phosphoribosyl 1,2-cyclic phosphodiesterase